MRQKDHIRLAIRYKVIPRDKQKVLDILKRYRSALNFTIQYINKKYTIRGNIRLVSLAIEIQREMYPYLRDVFGLPSYIANSCILDALVYKRLRFVPKNRPIKSLSMLIIPAGYHIYGDNITIFGVDKLKIVSKDPRYDSYPNRLARLVYKDGEMYLFIYKNVPIQKPEIYNNVLIVTLDRDYLYFGNSTFVNKIRLVALERALHYIKLAEKLKKKYPKAWRRRKGIYRRIRSFYKKAYNIIDNFTKQTALRLVKFAKQNKYSIEKWGVSHLIRQATFKNAYGYQNTIEDELLLRLSKKLSRWIFIQGLKHGVFVFGIRRSYRELICPRCFYPMKVPIYHKYATCRVCGYSEDKNILYIKQSEKIVKESLSKYINGR